jgi:hypothetical protein
VKNTTRMGVKVVLYALICKLFAACFELQAVSFKLPVSSLKLAACSQQLPAWKWPFLRQAGELGGSAYFAALFHKPRPA